MPKCAIFIHDGIDFLDTLLRLFLSRDCVDAVRAAFLNLLTCLLLSFRLGHASSNEVRKFYLSIDKYGFQQQRHYIIIFRSFSFLPLSILI